MITSGFDRWAQTYDDSALQPAYRAAHSAVLSRVRRLAGCPRRILDVGCGTGRLLRVASELFPHSVLVGADVSGGMLSIAGTIGSLAQRVLRVQAAAEGLPFADGTFDLVVSTASFRHWADHRAAMQEIGRVLVPGGLLGLADLFGPRRRGLAAQLARRSVLPPTFEAALVAAGLRTLGTDTVDGFGPITAITVVLARRPPIRGPVG